MEECARLVRDEAGIPAEIFEGTTLEGLGDRCGYVLARNGGAASVVVCYDGADMQNHPRRVSVLKLVVVSADTRVRPGAPLAMDAAWRVTDAIDDRTSSDTPGVTDHWRFTREAAADFPGLKAAAVLVLTLEIEDY